MSDDLDLELLEDDFEELAGKIVEVDLKTFSVALNNLKIYKKSLEMNLETLNMIRESEEDHLRTLMSKEDAERAIEAIQNQILDSEEEIQVIDCIISDLQQSLVNPISGNLGSKTTLN